MDNWAKYWSQWANKTRKEVIEMTSDLPKLGKYEVALKKIVKEKNERRRKYEQSK
jgi:endonuclease V-like protein UPF0215 family